MHVMLFEFVCVLLYVYYCFYRSFFLFLSKHVLPKKISVLHLHTTFLNLIMGNPYFYIICN